MPIIIDPNKIHEFIAHSQIDEPDPATILYRTLTVRDRQEIFRDHGEDHIGQLWAVLERCIFGWRNFNGPDGEPLEFTFDRYELLEDEYITDCYLDILERNKVTADEAGK